MDTIGIQGTRTVSAITVSVITILSSRRAGWSGKGNATVTTSGTLTYTYLNTSACIHTFVLLLRVHKHAYPYTHILQFTPQNTYTYTAIKTARYRTQNESTSASRTGIAMHTSGRTTASPTANSSSKTSILTTIDTPTVSATSA